MNTKAGSANQSLNFLRSLFFTDPLIYLYTIIMGLTSMVGSLWDSQGRFQHSCARIWARMILWTSRVKVEIEGLENLSKGQTYIYCSNHLSLIDTPVMFAHIPVQFSIMAKAGLFKLPFLGWHLRRCGHLPVERSSSKGAWRSFEMASRRVRAGSSMVFFPEGTRSRSGQMGPFKHGAALLAIKAQVPLAPVAIRGTREVLKPDTLVVHPGRVRLRFGPPLSTEGLTHRDAVRLTEQARQKIGEMLDEPSSDRHLLPA